MLIDEYMPVYDAFERHSIAIHAPMVSVYAAVGRLDMSRSRPIRWLFRLRSLPALLSSGHRQRSGLGLTLEGLLKSRFILLGERPPQELLLGLVGRFWTVSGDLQRLDGTGFRAFNQPGYAKATWNFALFPQTDTITRLVTETRVHCSDERSRRRFLRYWRLIRPFSGLIRKESLRAIKAEAESVSKLP